MQIIFKCLASETTDIRVEMPVKGSNPGETRLWLFLYVYMSKNKGFSTTSLEDQTTLFCNTGWTALRITRELATVQCEPHNGPYTCTPLQSWPLYGNYLAWNGSVLTSNFQVHVRHCTCRNELRTSISTVHALSSPWLCALFQPIKHLIPAKRGYKARM